MYLLKYLALVNEFGFYNQRLCSKLYGKFAKLLYFYAFVCTIICIMSSGFFCVTFYNTCYKDPLRPVMFLILEISTAYSHFSIYIVFGLLYCQTIIFCNTLKRDGFRNENNYRYYIKMYEHLLEDKKDCENPTKALVSSSL